MSTKAIIARLNRLLEPIGFNRQNRTWNRIADSFVDMVGLQVSKAGDTVTINVGVLDSDVYLLLWDSAPPNLIEEPICTVGARIGELVDGKDLWWQVDAVGVADELSDSVAMRALPFFEAMHAREAMKQWLISTNVMKKRYPAPIMNLAILECLLGDVARGCAILADLQKMTSGAWKMRAAEVGGRLRCAEEPR